MELMMLYVPVLVACSKSWRIGSCYIEACLVVLKGVTDERDVVAWNIKSGSDLLEDVVERNDSTHAGCER